MKTGARAPRFPSGGAPEAHPLETLALRLCIGLVAAGALLWLTGQLSGRIFGGAWPPVEPSEVGAVVVEYPNHVGDPAQAWPARARGLVPGPVAFYATFARSSSLPSRQPFGSRPAAAIAEPRRGARWARSRDLRPLRPHGRGSGRLTLGRVNGRLVMAEPRESAIVIGPTQTGKTTGFAIPAILEWPGPVVATSVKTDLLRDTLNARSSRRGAKTWVYDPTGSTGLPGAGWTP